MEGCGRGAQGACMCHRLLWVPCGHWRALLQIIVEQGRTCRISGLGFWVRLGYLKPMRLERSGPDACLLQWAR